DAPAGGSWTRLAVAEGAVEVRLLDQAGRPILVRAGEQARFTRHAIAAATPLDENSQAWAKGVFTAAGMRLDDFLAELGRYRPGVLRWAPEVAALRITGAWPLRGEDATDRILDSLERRLPVKVSRYTRYWTRVAARGAAPSAGLRDGVVLQISRQFSGSRAASRESTNTDPGGSGVLRFDHDKHRHRKTAYGCPPPSGPPAPPWPAWTPRASGTPRAGAAGPHAGVGGGVPGAGRPGPVRPCASTRHGRDAPP